jgi:hypothetical protein
MTGNWVGVSFNDLDELNALQLHSTVPRVNTGPRRL